MRTSVPGVATGLAWTPVGGDILFIEATRVAGQRPAHPHRPARRGHEGERAGGAVSIVKNRAASLGIDATLFEKSDIHVHVPAGAIPKDGPSAGVAMFMALVSLMTERTVRSDTAMTGEISLRGLVLPVGGIKEKVVAAPRGRPQARHAAGAQPQGLRRHPRGGARAARVRLAGAGRRRDGGGARAVGRPNASARSPERANLEGPTQRRAGRNAGAPLLMDRPYAGVKSAIFGFTMFMQWLGQPGRLTLSAIVPSTGRRDAARNNLGPMIVPVILSGGSGTRLWPLSRTMYPKQFIRFFNGQGSSFLGRHAAAAAGDGGLRRARSSSATTITASWCAEEARARGRDAAAPSCSSRWPATPRRPSRSPRCSSRARTRRHPGSSCRPTTSSRTSRAFVDGRAARRRGGAHGQARAVRHHADGPHTGYGYIRRGAPLAGFDGGLCRRRLHREARPRDRRSLPRRRRLLLEQRHLRARARAPSSTELARLEPAILEAAREALAEATRGPGLPAPRRARPSRARPPSPSTTR